MLHGGGQFPSPFGVHVLKSNSRGRFALTLPTVSVPFRGSRSETALLERKQEQALQVSVPFRGSRSEMQARAGVANGRGKFPSPFGVHVLKFPRPALP